MYDLETFNKIGAVPSCRCLYKLSKISCKYHRDITEKEYQKGLMILLILKEVIVLMKC